MPLHSVARFADVPEDRGLAVKIGKKNILLVRVGDQVRAFQGRCPHAGAPLADGAICNGRLICPWHKAVFALDDGALCEPPALDPLRRYPAQVTDGQVIVDDQPMVTERMASPLDPRCFVIIGAGAAGTAAASALREKGFGGRLILVDGEANPGYDRTALSKFVIAGDLPPEETPALREPAFYGAQHIERMHGQVTCLDSQHKRLTFRDGRQLDYDAALVATGGTPNTLDLPGAELPQVLSLRSRDDARSLLYAAQPGNRVVIIGDSFIGLEAASALRKRGLSVTVLARHETPFQAQFGPRIGTAIRRLHEQHGVLFRTHVEAARFAGDHSVRAVVLNTGEQLPADLVLVGTGVSPATGFVQGIAHEEDGSLRVDDGMRVSEGLWAAGDIATFPLAGSLRRIEHWRVAQQQARVAAQNMLGGNEHYADVAYFWTYHFEKRIDYLGHAEQWDDIIYLGEPEDFDFIALICKDGQVAAVVGCQRERDTAMLAEKMRQPLSVDEGLRSIGAL
jgi:NADPH-dependent 2,4-dienoyl-CoA reductase/sulfur reductase-like enzyme/nitrite reductase/ring-hydroxylating ferredoxin subunit